MVIEFYRILAKGLQRIYNSLFIYLFIYLKLNFFNPTHDRMLNFTYVCVFGSESSFFPLNLPILQFRPFFHFDNQSHCWLISYPEQSLEDNFKVNKTVEDLRHKNVV